DPHRGGGPRTDDPLRPDAFGNNASYPGMTPRVYDPSDVIVPPWLPDTPATRAEIAQYYQAVSRVDEGVGRLVQILKDAGQYENTVIFYLSDNGPAFPGAKTTLYEPGMNLPLIVRDPSRKTGGVVSDALVSWVDLTPTILDFAGVTTVLAPPRVQGDPEDSPSARPDVPPATPKKKPARARAENVPYVFHGKSFRPVLDGEPREGWGEVYASHTFHEITMYYPMRVVRTRRHKLILNLAHQLPYPFASDLFESATWQSALRGGPDARYGKRLIKDYVQRPRYELYDLENDPDEVVNLAERPEHKALFESLAGKLKDFQKATGDPWILKYDYE
ncbi:MAG: sulfatase-like hydrolase/transferase, partial [Isosphaeraceae bacterium]